MKAAFGTRIWGGLFCLLVGLSACGEAPDARAKRVRALLKQLENPSAGQRDSLLLALDQTIFVQEDIPVLTEALGRPFPDEDGTAQVTRSHLWDKLASLSDPRIPPFVEAGFPRLTQLEHQVKALQTLNAQDPALALPVLRALFQPQPPSLQGQEMRAFAPYFDHPQRIQALLPWIFSWEAYPEYHLPLMTLYQQGIAKGAFSAQAYPDSANLFLRLHQAARAARMQISPQEPAYQERLQQEQLSLQILAAYDTHPAVQQWQAQLDSGTGFRTHFLWHEARARTGKAVSDSVWQLLATNPLTRNACLALLKELEQVERLPRNLTRQPAVAEGDLAHWLSMQGYVQAARRLRLVSAYVLDTLSGGQGSGRVYLFQFTHQGRRVAGLSGPQPLDTFQFVPQGALTNSRFRQWGRRSEPAVLKELLP